MARLVIVTPSRLLADGIAAALREVVAWEVHYGSAADPADAWIVPGAELVVRDGHGAVARLAPDASPARLRAAVAAVLEGLSVRESAWPADAGDHEPLTPRELEVFELLAKGLSNREIGEVLAISAHTAKYHVAQILAKTGAGTRAEAVHEGLRSGVIGL